MPKLNDTQYNAIMQCIEHGRALLKDGDFIDPYDQENTYTEEDLTRALDEVESLLMTHCLE